KETLTPGSGDRKEKRCPVVVEELSALKDRNPVLSYQRLHYRLVFLHIGDFPCINLFLCDAASFGRAAGYKGGSTALNLTSATCGNKHLAIVRVETGLNRHRDPLQREVVVVRYRLQFRRPPAPVSTALVSSTTGIRLPPPTLGSTGMLSAPRCDSIAQPARWPQVVLLSGQGCR